MHQQTDINSSLLKRYANKTVVVTGGAAGIGAATVRLCNDHGANVVIADLDNARSSAEALINDLKYRNNAIYIPANILDWGQMNAMFKQTIEKFGRVDIAVANAGTIESSMVLDLDNVEADGEPKEPTEAYKVIDINLKGTLNTLKLAMHYMNKTCTPDSPGSILLVASTSGYFGGTGVAAYIASKHGVVGLLRSSQLEANKRNIRINCVSPFLTPTAITVNFAQQWIDHGLEANTPENVASVIAQTAIDEQLRGASVLTAGKYKRELEHTRAAMTSSWIGEDLAGLFSSGMKFLESIGGYPLPKRNHG